MLGFACPLINGMTTKEKIERAHSQQSRENVNVYHILRNELPGEQLPAFLVRDIMKKSKDAKTNELNEKLLTVLQRYVNPTINWFDRITSSYFKRNPDYKDIENLLRAGANPNIIVPSIGQSLYAFVLSKLPNPADEDRLTDEFVIKSINISNIIPLFLQYTNYNVSPDAREEARKILDDPSRSMGLGIPLHGRRYEFHPSKLANEILRYSEVD
jgi:hypothetical protein